MVSIERTSFEGLFIIRSKVFRDVRGAFMELWNRENIPESDLDFNFVQDNVSVSRRGVLRGLHAQRAPNEQGKLVTVLHGRVFDVAVDVRAGSSTFGRSFTLELDALSGTQLYIPPGFLHGFLALEDNSVLSYKCTSPYRPNAEISVRWDDATLGIEWPLSKVMLSKKDEEALPLHEIHDFSNNI